VVSVVAGVWEFATSGLEMGMVFLWFGLGFWLLVRLADRRRGAVSAAFVAGLGVLVRPELVLMSLVLLVAVGLVVGLPGWQGPTSPARRWVGPAAAALAVPAIYELWRMAYFAMLVPNTGLAKSAGSSWWGEGGSYLWNFVAPYALWVPLLLSLPLVARTVRRFWRPVDPVALVVLGAPLAAALLDTLYVVKIGGDYMHARLLLPAFFAGSLAVAVRVESLRTWLVAPVVGIGIWAIVCAGWLRTTEVGIDHVIINPRGDSIALTGRPHPVTADDYRASVLGAVGDGLHAAAGPDAPGQRMVIGAFRAVPARSSIPFTVATASGTIGVIGYLAGPRVYLFDVVSLANPIGSHTTGTPKLRPGHDKPIGVVWMVARFGVRGEALGPGAPTPASIADARRALACPPLRSYLHGITAPLTVGLAWSNLAHALAYSRMSFDADPTRAVVELCG
jgi:arabinofuranosyltransferase